jgi:hypothetical protein
MRRLVHITIALLLPLCLIAQEQESALSDTQTSQADAKKEKRKIFTGFSGGMMVHAGYAFAGSPHELFGNSSLDGAINESDLPHDGVTLGIGGAARVHLIDHIHVGMEGFVSTMPLMRNGSSVRAGWGGALLDYFFGIGKAKMFLGGTIGGGSMKRLYVPSNDETVTSTESNLKFNATYRQTGFGFIDPYIGFEFSITKRISVLTRVDYLLPFNKKLITPTGPRLYLGFMFGH